MLACVISSTVPLISRAWPHRAEIAIYPAENQTVLPGMAVTYFCRSASLGPDEFVNIQVNGTTLNPDYDPNIVIGDDYSVTFEMLTGNTTTVQCVISDGSSVPSDTSEVATIYIAGKLPIVVWESGGIGRVGFVPSQYIYTCMHDS